MKWRYAMPDDRRELKQGVEDNILLSRGRLPCPRGVPRVGAALKLGGPGFVTPSPISCHDIPQGSLPGADLSTTHPGRDNAAGPTTAHQPHPEDAPGSPRNCRRGGDFHLAKNGDRKLAIDTFRSSDIQSPVPLGPVDGFPALPGGS